MLTYLAVAGAALFGALALTHFAWAVTGRVPDAVIPTKRDGSRLFEPKRGESAAVGAGLLVAGFILLQRGNVGPSVAPHWLRAFGTGFIAVVMLLRAVGDRAYIGFTKRERASRFGRLDTRFFTPLVSVLAVVALVLAVGGH